MKIAALRIVLASFCLVAILGGCGGPSSKELSAINSGSAAIVLLRVTATEDGKLLDWRDNYMGGGNTDRRWPLAIWAREIGGGAEGPIARPRPGHAPSSESKKEGWRYVVLPAGTYRLSISNPYRNPWRAADGPSQAPSFWLNVARGQSLLYGGSIQLACSTNWEGSGKNACSGDIAAADESDAARAVARAAFAKYGPVTTALMRPFGDPIERALLRDLQPLALAAGSQASFISPDWKKRAKTRFGGFGADKEYPPRGGGGGGFYPGPSFGIGGGDSLGGAGAGAAGLFLAAGMVVYGGVIAPALAATDASSAERQWGPCMEGLARELSELDPMGQLRRRLREKLREQGFGNVYEARDPGKYSTSAANQGYKAKLQIDIQRIQLRECEKRGTFCFEVAVRARLLETGTNEPVYDTKFAYSNPTRRIYLSTASIWYSELVAEPYSECRDLAAYCGAGGRQLFRQELGRALEVLVKRILPESALAPR